MFPGRVSFFSLFLFFSTVAHFVIAQTIYYNHYTVDDGLANSIVYSIYQDRDGVMWFLTDNGISKFNGNKFVNYDTGQWNTYFTGMSEMTDGSYLITSYRKGFYSMDKNGGVKYFNSDQIDRPRHIYTDKLDVNWIIEAGGDGHILKDTVVREINITHPREKSVRYYYCSKYTDTSVLISTNLGPFIISGNKIQSLFENSRYESETVFYSSVDNEQNFLLGGLGVIYKMDKNRMICYRKGLPEYKEVRYVVSDKYDKIWGYANNFGLFFVIDSQIINLSSNFENPKMIVNYMMTDKYGDVWIATHGDGVIHIPASVFTNYTVKDHLGSNFVKSITQSKYGDIWIGGMQSINIFNQNTIKQLDNVVLLPNELIQTIVPINDKLLIGTSSKMIRIDQEQNNILIKGINVARSFFVYDDTTIWIGTIEGIVHMVKNEIQKSKILSEYDRIRIYKMIRDKSNHIWIATDNGLFVFQDTIIVQRYDITSGLPDDQVNDICLDGEEVIWAATNSGVAKINNGKIRTYNIKDGLAHSRCNKIISDKHNNILVGTTRGLSILSQDTFVLYNAKDGLVHDEIQELFIDRSENLWIGTVKGISLVPLKKLFIKNYTIPDLIINNITVDKKSFSIGEKITIEYNSTFSVSYYLPYYKSISDIVYNYKLEDDGEWVETKNDNILLASLAAGEYEINIKAKHKGEHWETDTQKIFLKVLKPFWQEWWFIFTNAFLLVGIVVYIFTKRVVYLKKREDERLAVQSRMVDLEHQALSALMNPHFMYNALNSIQFYLTKNDKESALKYLTKFAKLMRATLDNARNSFNSLEEELSRLNLYIEFEQLRFDDKFSYYLEIDDRINTADVIIPSMILQPFVENAIWHGIMPKEGKGKLSIKLNKIENNLLEILIEDDGIGMDEAKKIKQNDIEHKSSGMDITKERIILYAKSINREASIDIKSKNAEEETKGTIVSITLPI